MKKSHPLRRAVLAGAATVSGIVLLLALKPTTVVRAEAPAAAATASTGALSPSPTPSRTTASSPRPGEPAASTTSPRSAPASASPSPTRSAGTPSAPKTTSAPPAPTTRTVTGAAIGTAHGPIQVQITLTGSRITAARAVKSPSSSPRTREISSTAIPKLNEATVQAQSADIDTVSGATYTSDGYRQSLQSALDRAGA
ncbi:FMN-binding protein [Streptomyces sp. TRM49041]|uniref:FMN-binding protein n=1 Tax=Streptomyces sp. TRM49041 TaxID=2603216 RepID=UPI0011EF44D2|nr:FMN-binding protein [Streptomyces sp. TRM49041]